MLAVETQKKFEELLITSGLVAPDKLSVVRQKSITDHKSVLSIISDDQTIPEEDLVRVFAQANDVPYANLGSVAVGSQLLSLLPIDLARSYMAVPFGQIGDRLAVGMLDPTNIQAVDFIARKVSKPLSTFMVSTSSVNRVLAQYKADVTREVSAVIDAVSALEAEAAATQKTTVKKEPNKNLQNLVQDAPITRALNTIFDYAVVQKASDIHIEPREDDLKIRFRVDGILQDTMTLPKVVEPALISRIKILSSLKIDEHRIPQDGQFQIHSANRDIDLRIAIAPVVHGEQVVIRLLDKTNTILTLENLGFKGRAFRLIDEGIHKPHGMTLATGPTGSGKSTTLYAILAILNDIRTNIVTLEDPVEYKMNGINQMQINAEVGLTFAGGLRSILRQDPNIIMVGEIRDKETADLAVQAALTGHVVLSTLHTNSAAGVLPRLLDMQIEPFLIASTVNTVIGQRLVRRVCDKCIESFEATPAQAQSIQQTIGRILPKTQEEVAPLGMDLGYENLPLSGQSTYTLYRGKGCSECSEGYKGRLGIYEVFGMSNAMEKLLAKRATTSEIQAQAEADGMIGMKQDGYLKALQGITTLEEVARVAADF